MVAVAGAVLVALLRGGAPSERAQRVAEEVPGTLSLSLGVPEPGFRPGVTSEEAFRIAWDEPVETTTYVTLGVMEDDYYGNDARPDWIFISRAQCYPSAKGDIVSPARSGVPDGGCSDSNLALVSIDALSGEPAMSFIGFDIDQNWEPVNADPLFTAEQMRAAGGSGAPPG